LKIIVNKLTGIGEQRLGPVWPNNSFGMVGIGIGTLNWEFPKKGP